MTKSKIGIVGSTGYTGVELARLLAKHPNVSLEFLGSEQYAGQKLSDVYPELKGLVDLKCEKNELENLKRCDLIFFATPNGIASKQAPELISLGKKIIDLSADYRFRNLDTYQKWYDFKRDDKKTNDQAIYGLVEFKRDEIRKRVKENSLSLIANPGCYTSASILALAPILKNKNLCDLKSIIIDAKSGVSGAGRKAATNLLYSELNESVSPYNLANQHRHTPELEMFFSELTGETIELSFSPHLMPMTRGLLATCYINITDDSISEDDIRKIYLNQYGLAGEGERFVDILEKGLYPQTRWAVGTNKTIIQVNYDKRIQRLIITSALDNLIKGAAGQAMQNMNLLLGLAEETGF